jgi:hypothetical protein
VYGTVRLTFYCFASFWKEEEVGGYLLFSVCNECAEYFLKARADFAGKKKKLDVCVSNPKTAPADSIYYYDLQ